MATALTQLTAKQLRRAAALRERIDKLEAALSTLLGAAPAPAAAARGGRRRTAAAPAAATPKRKRHLSKAARAAASERLRTRWAKVKASGKRSL